MSRALLNLEAMAKETYHYIDPTQLPKHFDAKKAEEDWNEHWQKLGIYTYQAKDREQNFVVDTPPPTVSGSLHIGHVFSYTHTDILVRFQRMMGKNIFYPMGWDDNGLPTERRVQNYFHIRCEPHLPFDSNLSFEPANAKKRKEHPQVVSRKNFIEACDQVTKEDEKVYKNLFQRIGLSVDWSQEYATIDELSRKIAQLSFIDLFEKGHIYQIEAPTMWDIDFQTAVAQAEVEDRETDGAFHHIEFGIENSDESFVIATTRPELLPACVGIAAHPEDKRYKHLFGKNAVTPLFQVPVPVFATELADPEKGSGILMVCTFGDSTDVQWWREQKLPLRQIIGRNGRLLSLKFGENHFPSKNAKLANSYYSQLEGKNLKQARKLIVELLRQPEGSSAGERPPLQNEPKPLRHAVKFYEKGERPLEFMSTRQWFVRLMDKKAQLLEKGTQVQWHPEFMKARYTNWTENLQLDWCISRQRYFGVSFPVWYPLDKKSEPLYEKAILAESSTLPVDPMSDVPPGYTEAQRNQANGFIGEADVFDTWFTSSMTPQIGSRWQIEPDRHTQLFPSDIRAQSHEIIRTWAFYTIAKAMLHENKIPWRHIALSGWILDPDRKKMSKSKGNVTTPIHLIDKYSADAVRYWAASARLGVDTIFDETVLKVGRRLVTKLFNASKFVLSQKANKGKVGLEIDRAFLKKLNELVESATKSLNNFNFAQGFQDIEKFFWTQFTDSYLEIVKVRAREGEEAEQTSAVVSLRLGLQILLRLFAPYLPFITEEIWSWSFAKETKMKSIHQSAWPSEKDFKEVDLPKNSKVFDTAATCYSAINKFKTENSLSVGAPLENIQIGAKKADLDLLKSSLDDVAAATRVAAHQLEETAETNEGSFRIHREA